MIEDRDSVFTSFEPQQGGGAEVAWVGRDSSAGEAEFRGQRILLVEDEGPVRACLRMMLELEGHQVTEAGDGAEALKLFAIGEFDLVMTDLQMPVMQGSQLAVRLKRLAPSLPILMVTASGRARREAENPVDAVLTKPFTLSELRCALGRLLSARAQPTQPEVVPLLEGSNVGFAPEGQSVALLPA